MTFSLFSPHDRLASLLLPHSGACVCTTDGSHDFSHLLRVWKNATMISDNEGGDTEILASVMQSFLEETPAKLELSYRQSTQARAYAFPEQAAPVTTYEDVLAGKLLPCPEPPEERPASFLEISMEII